MSQIKSEAEGAHDDISISPRPRNDISASVVPCYAGRPSHSIIRQAQHDRVYSFIDEDNEIMEWFNNDENDCVPSSSPTYSHAVNPPERATIPSYHHEFPIITEFVATPVQTGRVTETVLATRVENDTTSPFSRSTECLPQYTEETRTEPKTLARCLWLWGWLFPPLWIIGMFM